MVNLNLDYVVICVNQGVNKCNLQLILEHPDPGINLPVQQNNKFWRTSFGEQVLYLKTCCRPQPTGIFCFLIHECAYNSIAHVNTINLKD